MGKLAVQKYFSFMMLIISFVLMIFTFVGLYGGTVPPAGNTARAMLVYALPLLIAGNVIFLVYWLIRLRFHWALMPLHRHPLSVRGYRRECRCEARHQDRHL